MRTPFGATLGLAIAFIALATLQPDAHAQNCANVTVQIGNTVGAPLSPGQTIPIQNGDTIGFWPIVQVNGNPVAIEDILTVQWWFSETNLVGDGTDPPPNPTINIDPMFPIDQAPNLATFTYEDSGTFDIGIRVLIRNLGATFFCPPDQNVPFVFDEAVVTPDAPPTANFSATHLVEDQVGIVPLNDWVPLFSFIMSFSPDQPAPRALTQLNYRLTPDPNGNGENPYAQTGGPFWHNVLEFGLFRDFGDGGPDNVFNPDDRGCVDCDPVTPFLTWDAQGFPYEQPDENGVFDLNDAEYNLNFVVDPNGPGFTPIGSNPTDPFGTNANPFFPTDEWVTAGPDPGRGFIVAVRMSSSWQAGQTMSVTLERALMQLQIGNIVGNPNFDDGYSPDFFMGDDLVEDVGYSASFGVWDIRAGVSPDSRFNTWNWPTYSYTPLTEFVRPRWDLGAPVDFVFGEVLDIRDVRAVETWVPLLGIDLHGQTWGDYGIDNGDDFISDTGIVFEPLDQALPYEVNVVVTDVGADPFGVPGNGGFDPTEGLETLTSRQLTIPGTNDTTGIGNDSSFNGISIYEDTNNNGIFDPPVPIDGTGPGVSFADGGDFPLAIWDEGGNLFVDPGLLEWEYIPFPPGGGDPWWKIRLNHFQTRVGGGILEPVPDTFRDNVPRPDYFVVLRADSGFEDVSGLTGDGTGIALGADTRAFIEPRRWNPTFADRPRWDGGIGITNQVNFLFNYTIEELIALGPDVVEYRWQEDPRWDVICTEDAYPCETAPAFNAAYPYFAERTSNRDTNKPIKFGADVHDLVLTYSTNNVYAKETTIHVGNGNFPAFMDPDFLFVPDRLSGAFGFFGILEYRFVPADVTTIIPDVIFGFDDSLTVIQYAFETVPFKLNDDAIDAQLEDPRSFFFPNPQEQPTLPRFATWPQGTGNDANLLGSGLSSYVYLDSEGAMANEPFLGGTSSNSENSYRDDVYIAVVEDGVFANGALDGAWFVDEDGGKYRIISNTGNRLTLTEGHGAYLDRAFRFAAGDLQVPDHPFQVPVGEAAAVRRGPWLVVQDALPRGTYQNRSDWPEGLLDPLNEGLRAARILKQHSSPESRPTAMLGVNLAGTDDPAVNAEGLLSLNSLTVAFWGPEFTPDDLQPLDPDGELFTAGVVLYEDIDQDGVFGGFNFDRIVPLEENSLRWTSAPEPIDIDGDLIADDMSGDGVVFLGDESALTAEELAAWDGISDLAWVLRLQPRERWTVPTSDNCDECLDNLLGKNGVAAPATIGGQGLHPKAGQSAYASEQVFGLQGVDLETEPPVGQTGQKALPVGNSIGDDLFVAIRTSETIGAFERFRALVPSRLPTRSPQSEQIGGIEMTQRAYTVAQSFEKRNPEEGAVFDFFGHDMLETNVGARVIPLDELLAVDGTPTIEPGSPAQAIIGLDLSVNRPEFIAASGTSGTLQAADVFTTGGTITAAEDNIYFVNNAWTTEAIGLYLMALSQGEEDEARYEAYEITGVNGLDLTLRAGAPRNGSDWAVIRDPSFLEQVIVEFYDEGSDGDFDLQKDLLPLDFEDPINGFQSGVALYRDNDWHPSNTNGVFDPPVRDEFGNVLSYIDLPITLDDPPSLIGTVGGEPENQVRFVFSSPGTDDSLGRDPMPYEDQPRLRQWVPQTYGNSQSDPDFGPDFFVVVRTTRQMALDDDFFAGIASWGPDTPTEPDPDNFAVSLPGGGLPGQREDEFDIFSEFPWGSRALGFITFFRDPPPVRYWTNDRDSDKLVVRSEVDRSQDDKDIRYWVRSNTNAFGRTGVITASEPPSVDFSVNRIRQVPGPFCQTLSDPPADCGEIEFTLIANGTISSILWDFGDGTTSTDRNPVKTYDDDGVYTVTVTVTDAFGVDDSATKVNLIQIMSAPLADFTASPTDDRITPKVDGPDGLDVSFVDLSIGTDDLTPVSYFWNFGDGETALVTERPTEEAPLVHRYTVPGFYTVTLEVTFVDDVTTETQTVQCVRANLINVRPCIAGCANVGEGEGGGEGEGEGDGEPTDPPAADITFTDFIRDRDALVPLHDWVPLFEFTIGFAADNPAPRILSTLIFDILGDDRDSDDLNYANFGGPDQSDLLEFAVFQQTFDDSGEDATLNFQNDFLLFSWDNSGAPVGQLTPLGGRLRYELDFIGDGTPDAPEFPIVAAPAADEGFAGNSYIIAVRTSATWRSQLTMGAEVLRADLVIPGTGVIPTNAEGDRIDTYSPDLPTGETLLTDGRYSASFTASDATGSLFGAFDETIGGDVGVNFWNHPNYLYFPADEFTRPRWNQIDRFIAFGGGEILEMRELVPMEAFWPVINLNIHSGIGEHFDGFIDRLFPITDGNAHMTEVNLVLTDIGGDPFGPPGNGGFNAPDGLERITDERGSFFEPAEGRDYAFNGAWVWHDTNDNGRFDPPTAALGQGITFADRPMRPLFGQDSQADWEWIPLPPGGGDPWWKITLRFDGLERLPDGADPDGFLEASPDNHFSDDTPAASEVSSDYFVVVRTDSGFQDISSVQGDQKGVAMGADFRAFIEPRRFDPIIGVESGGIYVDSMIPPLSLEFSDSGIISRWQDDPQFTDAGLPSRWGEFEPWWPQRTMNENSAKPVKVGLDVHDLVLTYESTSSFVQPRDLNYFPPFAGNSCLGYALPFNELTSFDRWVDPFGLLTGQFFNMHGVDVIQFGTAEFSFQVPITGIGENPLIFVSDTLLGQFSYETVPFTLFNPITGELETQDSRSSALPTLPTPPAVPDFSSWPATLAPGEYQRASQWDDADAAARLLTQKSEIQSAHVAMLGINTVGADDLNVNDNNALTIDRLTVALWGPDFAPSDLAPLDENGQSFSSGLLLWEDADNTGSFFELSGLDPFFDSPLSPGIALDQVVPLRNLRWESAPELIDLDGDGVADDMNGDGQVTPEDRAWVLQLDPEDQWVVPHTDTPSGFTFSVTIPVCGGVSVGSTKAGAIAANPGGQDSKALDPDLPQSADDLFITVRTSDRLKRFESFRAVIPASLPERATAAERRAGIQYLPGLETSASGLIKSSPDEGAVQDFYGHDMLEINVPVKITSLVNSSELIFIGGPALATLGIDASSNQGTAAGTLVSGDNGVGGAASYVVGGAAWEVDSFAGDFLIDNQFESYRIVSNTADRLTLESGIPRDGVFKIVRNPTFLEEVIVEFYNEDEDADFSYTNDLLPLAMDQEVSGVAIYRDNDNHPENTNGVFDPFVDIPLQLDGPPHPIGQTGEDSQVRFVFSSPGTDSFGSDARNRQWIFDTFGGGGDEATGPDFFIVLRASDRMQLDDNFRMGIVSWGPNTPTEPDPDSFAPSSEQDATTPVNDFAKFREFPWAQRGLGFITYFKEPRVNYFMDGARAGQREDNSGFDWVRSHSAKKRRSGVITARDRSTNNFSVIIDGTSEPFVPPVTLPGESFDLIIRGSGFGTSPLVVISGYEVEVVAATSTRIDVSISTPDGVPAQNPVIVIVRNPVTGEEGSYDGLEVREIDLETPTITGISPGRGDENVFPVTITGTNLPDRDHAYVTFGSTRVPVLSVSPAGTSISVGYPAGGFPQIGPMDVMVRAVESQIELVGPEDILVAGFDFVATTNPPKIGFLGCAPAPNAKSGSAGDKLVVTLMLLLLLAGALQRAGGWRYLRRAVARGGLAVFVVAVVALAQPAMAFFPIGGFDSNQILWLTRWPFGTFDLDNNGQVDPDEGLEVIIEVGPSGFFQEELDDIQRALDTWADVPTSYASFRVRGLTEDFILSGLEPDTIQLLAMQVTGLPDTGEEVVPDPADVIISELGGSVLGINIILFAVEAELLPTPEGGVFVPAGTIIDSDIIISDTAVRPLTNGLEPEFDLAAIMTHELGHMLGFGHTPLNNLTAKPSSPQDQFTLSVEEDAVFALTDSTGVQRKIGVTPTMFPSYFETIDSDSGVRGPGADTLAPDEISGVSWLYPRGSQANFFTLNHESRSETRPGSGLPSIGLPGAHVVAWADHDNSSSTSRIPMFSTMAGLYEPLQNAGLQGLFDLIYIWKQFEVPGAQPAAFFNPTYTFTNNPLNFTGLARQAPPLGVPADFDSIQGPVSFSVTTRSETDSYTNDFPSEVFEEVENIIDIENKNSGTPMIWSFELNTLISAATGRTLPTILPNNRPMFGDPNDVCPLNLVQAGDGTGTTTTPDDGTAGAMLRTGNNKLRGLRDGLLLQSALGTMLVDAYYTVAPALTQFLKANGWAFAAFRYMVIAMFWTFENGVVVVLNLAALAAAFIALRNKRGRALLARLFLFLLVVGVSFASHATVVLLTDTELATGADAVITGTVTSTEGRWALGGRIYTDVVLEVEDTVKGNINKQSEFTFSVLGGRVGGFVMRASELPTFAVGEEVVLFMKQLSNGEFVMSAGEQGRVRISSAAGKKEVIRPAEALTVPEEGDEEKSADLHAGHSHGGDTEAEDGEAMPLDEYLDFLRDAVRKQKREEK